LTSASLIQTRKLTNCQGHIRS